jgi:type I restriction enzyme S subunit
VDKVGEQVNQSDIAVKPTGAWQNVRLGELMSLDERRTPVVISELYPMAGVYSFGKGLFDRAAVTSEKTSYKHLNRLVEGQFVVSRLKAWEGAVAVVGPEHSGLYLSPEFPTYTLNQELIIPSFWSLLCSRKSLWEQLATTSRGMGGRRERVHKVGILDLQLSVPSLPEQKRIVDFVGSFDVYINNLEIQSEWARAARAAILPGLLSGSGGDWPETTIARVVAVNPETRRSLNEASVFKYIDIGSVSAEEGVDFASLQTHSASTAPSRAQRVVRSGDIIVSTVRPNLRVAARIGAELEGEIASTGFAVLRTTSDVHPGFIWALVRSEPFVRHLVNRATGSSYPAVKPADICSFSLRLPPYGVQQEVAQLVESFDNHIASLAALVKSVRTFRQGVLLDVLSGRTVLGEAYDVAVG